MSKDYPWGKGTPKWVRDATLNDSDKTFTVPAGKVWDLLSIQWTLVTTATVGNRTLKLYITNGTDVVFATVNYTALAASSQMTGIHYAGLAYGTNSTLLRVSDGISTNTQGYQGGLPSKMLLPAGYVIRLYDSAAVDAAADDLTVVLHYVEYDA